MTSNYTSTWHQQVKKPLRNYQVRMCDSANGKNTIVVLPTGSGKTMIATALATHYARQGGRTLFLVPTQMLVAQQARAVMEDSRVELNVKQYHGELVWPKDYNYHVLVSTPESFRLRLASQETKFEYFSLIIFDEVHHVMKKHPYRKIARLLECELPCPTILGLTATCTYSVEEKDIKSDIKALCAALRISNILTATTDELVADGYHGATPTAQLGSSLSVTDDDEEEGEMFDVFEAPKVDSAFMPHQMREAFFSAVQRRTADPLVLRIMDLTRLVEADVLKLLPTFNSPLDARGKNGKVTAWSTYASKLRVPQSDLLIHLYESLRLTVISWGSSLDLVQEYLRMTIKEIHLRILGPHASVMGSILYDGANEQYSQRFKRLTAVLKQQLEAHRSSFRGILFVQQKITTHILKHFIDRTPELAVGFRTECIYATSDEASPVFRVTPSQSKERIGLFAKGAVNLLISTAVAEEGMDIPAANCIIRFDPIQTPVSLVQGRGRARQENSSFVVMEQRADRTVERLGQAEHAQMNLLKKSEEVLANTAEEERKRKEAQQNRERSAKMFLATGKGNAISLIKVFCQKTDREVVEVYKKCQGGWCATLSVVGFEGEKTFAEAISPNKQEAKANAYGQLYAHFKRHYGIV